VRNLPLAIFQNVDEGVTTLDLGSINAHGELVDSGVLGPVSSDHNLPLQNLSLGLLEKEFVEVTLDGSRVITGLIRDGREEYCAGGVAIGND